MDLSEFDFLLPPELIAQTPSPEREGSRMMVVDRSRDSISHTTFREFPVYLKDRPVVVLNDTRVLPARLRGRIRGSGRDLELLLVQETTPATWLGLARGLARLKPGTEIDFSGDTGKDLKAVFLGMQEEMGVFNIQAEGDISALLDRLGKAPLPPYIRRAPDNPDLDALDRERYQTVFASQPGAIAAPTAGLHFSRELLDKVRGLTDVVSLTLHVGVGTFQPIRAEQVETHRMHKEYYRIPPATWNALVQARREQRPVLAVGTTSTRTLESVEFLEPRDHAVSGWTDRFIYPGHTFKNVDRLLTNFHLPKSTLFLLVCAFAGRDLMMRAYQEAIEARYRFFSYGDAMLIL